jgi:hypothetical protein
MAAIVCPDRPAPPQSEPVQSTSALLDTFGCIACVTDAVRIRFAQAPELGQKRGKVGGVKQRLLAELDAFEVTSRCSGSTTRTPTPLDRGSYMLGRRRAVRQHVFWQTDHAEPHR